MEERWWTIELEVEGVGVVVVLEGALVGQEFGALPSNELDIV